MGTGTDSAVTKKVTKPLRCSICREVIKPSCDWQQGRCPHRPSLVDEILSNPHKSRFYNLLKFFQGRK